jgi:hypothetical protein
MVRLLMVLGLGLALSVPGMAGAGAAGELAQTSDKALCMKSCLDQNPGEKSSCAIQCGLVDGGVMQPVRDCGVEYKDCMQACGKNEDCRKQCRTARRNCI